MRLHAAVQDLLQDRVAIQLIMQELVVRTPAVLFFLECWYSVVPQPNCESRSEPTGILAARLFAVRSVFRCCSP